MANFVLENLHCKQFSPVKLMPSQKWMTCIIPMFSHIINFCNYFVSYINGRTTLLKIKKF